MDQTIVNLDENLTDQATKKMLQNVVDRKKKYDYLKKKHLWTTIVSITLGFLLVGYLYYFFVKPYSYSFLDMVTSFFGHSQSLFYCLAVIGAYGYMLILKKKTDKAEKEYHALRCEIVDRSKDLWKHENAWRERHKIFQVMKETYDINLYHENK